MSQSTHVRTRRKRENDADGWPHGCDVLPLGMGLCAKVPVERLWEGEMSCGKESLDRWRM